MKKHKRQLHSTAMVTSYLFTSLDSTMMSNLHRTICFGFVYNCIWRKWIQFVGKKSLLIKSEAYSHSPGKFYIAFPITRQGCKSLLNIRSNGEDKWFLLFYSGISFGHRNPLFTVSWQCKTPPVGISLIRIETKSSLRVSKLVTNFIMDL